MSYEGPLRDDFVFIPGFLVTNLCSQNSKHWIYEANDREDLQKKVVIQVARANDDETQAQYLGIENRLGDLDHPGIPALLDAGRVEGYPYLVFDWLPESDLTTVLPSGQLRTPEQALAILVDVAAVLEHAHQRDIAHGDLHAKRIGYSANGRLGVTGFGEAAYLETIGNIHHWAPEQLEHGQSATTPRSDLYALAELAYFLLCGRYPLSPANRTAIVPSSDLCPNLPPAVDAIIARGMAADPQHRYSTASEFVQALAVALHLDHRASKRT